MQSNSDRSRSLSPAARSTSRTVSPSPTRSLSRSQSRSRSRSRSGSQSSSDESRSRAGLYGSDFETLRNMTRQNRSAQLLSQVMGQAEYYASRGQTSTTFWCDVPDDLSEWLVDELSSRHIFAELISNEYGHYDQIYLELEEYRGETLSTPDSPTSGDRTLFYMMLTMFAAMMTYFMTSQTEMSFSAPTMVETVRQAVNRSAEDTFADGNSFTDSYYF